MGVSHGNGTVARLLPWTEAGGKPCYVVGDGEGYVSRLADDIESVQLGMAGELLGHAADILADHRVTGAELRFLLARMTESLTDVHRIAESRGARLSSVPPTNAASVSDAGAVR
ncbi:hypothetical protein SGFS_074400 [Streptomyces graminofaciens]|jgi:hypothetical protein|uniref:Uncharacterized protein n=1 Tax=Streptomyces graminofaciens TaxID=68212 RepID=A0ABN5VRN6_9ACTN|nr:hypothetical protein [Streptomyces graminofaciens]BBC36146.1 hypothetical protein SGFS_074400 [Streptomyces graminofaciens]